MHCYQFSFIKVNTPNSENTLLVNTSVSECPQDQTLKYEGVSDDNAVQGEFDWDSKQQGILHVPH